MGALGSSSGVLCIKKAILSDRACRTRPLMRGPQPEVNETERCRGGGLSRLPRLGLEVPGDEWSI